MVRSAGYCRRTGGFIEAPPRLISGHGASPSVRTVFGAFVGRGRSWTGSFRLESQQLLRCRRG